MLIRSKYTKSIKEKKNNQNKEDYKKEGRNNMEPHKVKY